jgi:Fic family protein
VRSQFATFHPFLDGNGRMGQALITLLLCQQGIIERPLLYLSYSFKRNRVEHYDRLQAVRDGGDGEAWMKFFLRGGVEVSSESAVAIREILSTLPTAWSPSSATSACCARRRVARGARRRLTALPHAG